MLFNGKALKLAHMLLHAQREVEMIADVAQAASDGLNELDAQKVDKAEIDAIIHSLQELSTSMNAAIQALNSEKVSRTDVETLIQNAIATHNNSDESHSTFLAIR